MEKDGNKNGKNGRRNGKKNVRQTGATLTVSHDLLQNVLAKAATTLQQAADDLRELSQMAQKIEELRGGPRPNNGKNGKNKSE